MCEACCCVLSPRAKAVRLVANKLFTEPSLEDAVERFATAAVRELVAAPTPAAHAEDSSAFGNGVKLESASGPATALAGAREGAAAGQGGDIGDGGSEGVAGAAEEELARRRCQLFCALCTKRHALLRTLFEVYGQVSAAASFRSCCFVQRGLACKPIESTQHVRNARLRQASDSSRRAVRADAPGLARTVGANAAILPTLLADLPPGSEQLALQMLYVLTGTVFCIFGLSSTLFLGACSCMLVAV